VQACSLPARSRTCQVLLFIPDHPCQVRLIVKKTAAQASQPQSPMWPVGMAQKSFSKKITHRTGAPHGDDVDQ
jgi:hypothetical protein